MTTVLYRKLKNGKTISWSTKGNFKGGKTLKKCLHCNIDYLVFNYRKNITKYCSKKCLASNKTEEISKNWKGGLSNEDKKIRG